MRACLVWVVLGAAASACSHDLDSLREQAAAMAGTDDSGSGGDGMGGDGPPPPQACEPCSPLPALAETLGVRSCCRGALGRECGVTLGDAAVCLPRGQVGRPDTECPGASLDALDIAGCCRPDGRCGLDAPQVGCVAREDLRAALPNAGGPVSCTFECTGDRDCAGEDQEIVCVDDEAAAGRVCARLCARDADCGEGEICGSRNDGTEDRVVAVCQPPIGDAKPGAACGMPRDCERGWCVQFSDASMTRCTQLCATPTDCPGELPSCLTSQIQGPVPADLQDFRICAP